MKEFTDDKGEKSYSLPGNTIFQELICNLNNITLEEATLIYKELIEDIKDKSDKKNILIKRVILQEYTKVPHNKLIYKLGTPIFNLDVIIETLSMFYKKSNTQSQSPFHNILKLTPEDIKIMITNFITNFIDSINSNKNYKITNFLAEIKNYKEEVDIVEVYLIYLNELIKTCWFNNHEDKFKMIRIRKRISDVKIVLKNVNIEDMRPRVIPEKI